MYTLVCCFNLLKVNCLKIKKMKFRLLTILVFLAILFSCKKKDATIEPFPAPAPAPELPASTQNNVAYGTDPLQKFDLFLPANRSTLTTKVMIVIHGGGWSLGDKADMSTYVDILKTRLPDYAFFNINYRLTSTANSVPFPAQELDVKALTEFIYNKRAEYKISDKFVLLGASAGAHLALLQAYKYASPKIKAVVDIYGPTDMADMYNNPASTLAPPTSIAFIVTGSPFATPLLNAGTYSISSPITYVSTQSAPTIIFHGAADSLVRLSQSTSLRNKLAQNNIVHQYVVYPNENHAYQGASLTDTFEKTIAFLTANVQ
jgi:acetyl esterase/lipase